MKNLESQIKNIYDEATSLLKDLLQDYIKIEEIMRGNTGLTTKFATAQKFEKLKGPFEVTQIVNSKLLNVCTDQDRANVIKSNPTVKDSYEAYLWYVEEVEYQYPHTKGAVEVFNRDIIIER